jgi:hypothetical protein
MVRGELTDNQWQCVFNLSTNMGFSNGSNTFQNVANSNPVVLRNFYQVIYIAPGIGAADYGYLQQMVAPGGLIEQFVWLGGVAVINVAGLVGDEPYIAPSVDPFNPVSFSQQTQHDSENILATGHPYITGQGFGGSTLGAGDFASWGPTDLGTITNLPADATKVLSNTDGISWAEYQYGAGRVIVTTLTYCWDGKPNSQLAAAKNLLLYSRFFLGSAFTPAPTVTPSGSPTPTTSPPPSRTPTPTYTPSPTRTPTATVPLPTATATPAVALIDVIAAIFGDSSPLLADVNGDEDVTVADVSALVQLLQ